MELIHKWKHWQLFILIFAVPLLGNFILLGLGISAAIEDQNPEAIFSIFSFFPLLIAVPMLFQFLWQWSIGVGLQKYLPSDVKLPVLRFKIFLLFPTLYFCFFMFLMGYFISGIEEATINNQDVEMIPGASILRYIGIFLLLHFFAVFCMFYCFYFCAKTFKSVMLQREAKSSDYIGDFFLLWFNIVGVWIIQPKINQLTNNVKTENETIDS